MTGGQIAALICAILLLLPGGCFLIFGIGIGTGVPGGWPLLLIAVAILAAAGLLFWVACRGRGPDQDAPPP